MVDLSKLKGSRATCIDCGKTLGIDDFICCIDPYSCQETRDRSLRINLCRKCYDIRNDNAKKLASGEVTTEELVELTRPKEKPEPEIIVSRSAKKKKKLERKQRRDLINKNKAAKRAAEEEQFKAQAQEDRKYENLELSP